MQVLDNSTDPAETPFQVPVKVFRDEDIPPGLTPEKTWNKVAPVIENTTDTVGQAILTFNSGCLAQDNYTIIANYAEQFRESFVSDTDGNWAVGSCSGLIEREIAFTISPPGDLNSDNCTDRADLLILLTDVRNGPPNDPAHDLNEDGNVNIGDVRYLVTLFSNRGGAPCP